MAKKAPRKKVPKELAVINADNCTGCESCLEVCPVDCIELKSINRGVVKGNETWCEIDLARCVGCEVCVHIPQKKSNPYELLVCPWDAIEMVPTENVAQVVAEIGGPSRIHPRTLGSPWSARHSIWPNCGLACSDHRPSRRRWKLRLRNSLAITKERGRATESLSHTLLRTRISDLKSQSV